MIEIKNLVSFIEERKQIKLFPFQVKYLENLIDGITTKCPRNMGKTMLINAYTEYIEYINDGCDKDQKYDDYISGDEVFQSGLLSEDRVVRMMQRTEDDFNAACKEYVRVRNTTENEYCIKWRDFIKADASNPVSY